MTSFEGISLLCLHQCDYLVAQFEVSTALLMKIKALWDVTLIDV
jgi:hypothetical protein